MAEVLRGSASSVIFSSFAGVGKNSLSARSKPAGVCVSFQYLENGVCPKGVFLRSNSSREAVCLFTHGDFQGSSSNLLQPRRGTQARPWRVRRGMKYALQVYAAQTCIPRTMRWWEKGTTPNMREVHSAQELIDSLLNAGDKLLVVSFFAPGCGACRSLHPKICQLAEMNRDVEFVKVNYEENKSMCYSLNIHVLPFFQFYRGAQGRVCSFSCTNATIKKFKDALAKHNTPRCSLGPPIGFGEPELLALSKNKSLSFNMPAHVGADGKEKTTFVVGSDRRAEDLASVGPVRKSEDSVPFEPSPKSNEPALMGAAR